MFPFDFLSGGPAVPDWLLAAFGALAAVITASMANHALRDSLVASRQRREAEARAWVDQVRKLAAKLPPEDRELVVKLAAERLTSFRRLPRYEIQSGEALMNADADADPEVVEEVNSQVAEIAGRLEQVEQTVSGAGRQLADTVLVYKIETLERQLEKIETTQLTKWDVATVVFAIIAALGAVGGLVSLLMN